MENYYNLHSECGVGSVDNGRDVRTVGGIKFFQDNILGLGSEGTIVYEGEYVTVENLVDEKKNIFSPAAVKCYTRERFDSNKDGDLNRNDTTFCRNINWCYRTDEDKGFAFAAMRRCDYDLRHLVKAADGGLFKENGYPSPHLLQLMKDMVTGLNELHSFGIIHGNLKPSHVLIRGDKALLSGMGSSRRLVGDNSSLGPDATISGSSGWRSPEQILNSYPQTPAMDMFNLGCALFFILTKGKHPFGDLPDRDINVANNNIVNLFMVEHIPVVKDLLSRLLKSDPELRPKASEVLAHPLFWNNMKRLWFLIDVRWRTEDILETTPSIVAALERKADLVFSKTRFKDDPLITGMRKRISSRFGKVQTLLCIIYKTWSKGMSKELPTNIQELVGPMPEGLDNYIGRTFPNLLTVVYDVIRLHCYMEENFRSYFEDDTGPMIVPDVGRNADEKKSMNTDENPKATDKKLKWHMKWITKLIGRIKLVLYPRGGQIL